MRVRIILVGLMALTVLAYFPVRQTPPLYEDGHSLQAAHWRMATVADLLPGRYLVGQTFAFDQWRAPRNPIGAYHQTNLALHLIAGLLVFALVRRVASDVTALISVTVFWLMPFQTEAVSYLSGRADLLVTVASLCALIVVAMATHWDEADVCGTILIGLGAFLMKESAVALLLLIPLVAWAKGSRSWKASLWPALILGVLAMAAWPLARRVTESAWPIPLAPYVAAQVTTLWLYLGLLVVPAGLSITHDTFAWPLWVHAISIALAVVAVGWMWTHRVSHRGIVVGLGFALCAIAPRFLVQMPDPIAEHQCYLASVGVSWAVAETIQSLARSRRALPLLERTLLTW